jgi:hypothetical protein
MAQDTNYAPFEKCNTCGGVSVLTVRRHGIVADRCANHSTGLRGAAEENRDGSWEILVASDMRH